MAQRFLQNLLSRPPGTLLPRSHPVLQQGYALPLEKTQIRRGNIELTHHSTSYELSKSVSNF
jgi:hypothetical protein